MIPSIYRNNLPNVASASVTNWLFRPDDGHNPKLSRYFRDYTSCNLTNFASSAISASRPFKHSNFD